MKRINEIQSRNELADLLGVPIGKLTYTLYVKGVESYYESFEIPKKNGDVRHINAPTGDLKRIQKTLAEILQSYQKQLQNEGKIQMQVSHAFEKDKGIISNAKEHRNKHFVLNLDLENFFDMFHFGRVRGFFEKNRNFELPIEVATIIAQLACYEGKLPQGAPTSPVITNLIFNILDIRIMKIAKQYKLDYTRYADDLTFSTNDKLFLEKYDKFLGEIQTEIERFGFKINERKTRLLFCDSKQEVTGLVVNRKISVDRRFCKKTRAMADSLYRNGWYEIDGNVGTINQLEGRFSFINQIDRYNNELDGKKHNCFYLNGREKQYQQFLFYKYFYANAKPYIVTEGKTDIAYIKAALKKYYQKYPRLITKKDGQFEFLVSFMNRGGRFKYFFKIEQDGADAMKNIYNHYVGKNSFSNLARCFNEKYAIKPKNPVILIFDNEQKTKRPLKVFKEYLGLKEDFKTIRFQCLVDNLYVLTNPLINGQEECEIEDLFDEETLNTVIDGKSFIRKDDYDVKQYYGKAIFSQHVAKNYKTIDFSEFIPMLDDINMIVTEYTSK